MTTTVTEALATLDSKLDELQAGGQIPEQFAALARELTLALQKRDWPAAEAVYAKTAQFAAVAGDVATEALSLYGQGIALFQLDRIAEARPLFQRAARLAEQIGHRALAAKAHYILSGLLLDVAEPDLNAILAEQTRGLEQVDADKDPGLAAQLYQGRASMRGLQLDLPGARADLDAALTLAQKANNLPLAATIRTTRRLLDNFASETPNLDVMFDALDEQAEIFGVNPTPTDLKLRQAITAVRHEDFARALELAEAARQETLEATDPARYFRYLSACFIIAGIHEITQNYPAVIATLLTCKGTLEDVPGKDYGDLVRPFLDSLPARWGAEKFNAALQTYRQQMQAKMGAQ